MWRGCEQRSASRHRRQAESQRPDLSFPVRLYFDHNVNQEVIHGLRLRGLVVTALDRARVAVRDQAGSFKLISGKIAAKSPALRVTSP